MKRLLPAALALILSSSLTAESLVYRETSNGKTTQETGTLVRTNADGITWETVSVKDRTSRVGRNAEGLLVAAEGADPESKWALKVEGDELKASGQYKGKALSGSLALKGRLWTLGFDQPLRWAVTHKTTGPLSFLMINVTDVAKPQEMLITPDGKDTVQGKPALRFKLGLPGAMAMFWGATIWADPVTGEQVQYKGNKGPGTPEVVLVIERQG